MSGQTDVRTLKAQKNHCCSWCDKRISAGETYKRYRWYESGNGEPSTVKMHQECYGAMVELANENSPYGPIDWMPGDFPRGCNCDFDPDCPSPHCTARRRIQQSAARVGQAFKQLQAR